MLDLLKRYVYLAVLLIFLIGCLLFAGAGREGKFAHAIVQSSAAIGIAILTITWPSRIVVTPIKTPILILLGLSGIALLQCIPLPESVWRVFPGRGLLVDGFHTLGVPSGPMPLSLDAEATLATAGYAIPPIFVMLLCLRVGIRRLKVVIPWFMMVAATGSVAFGMTQLIMGSESGLYFYEMTNVDFPVSTFANVNHFANFLMLALPFVIFLIREFSINWRRSDEQIAMLVAISGSIMLIVAGIVAAGSLAIYLLTVPVVIAALVVIKKPRSEPEGPLIRVGILAISLVAIVLVASGPLLYGLGAGDFSSGHLSRLSIWSVTVEAIQDHWPIGTGIGTYPSVIPLYENPDRVTSTYIARAHNEYLQLIMEAGILGLLIIGYAFSWLGLRIWKIWRSESNNSETVLKRIASLSILAIVIHSVVDFPLRTPSIGVFFAMFIALIALEPRAKIQRDEQDKLNPKRVVL